MTTAADRRGGGAVKRGMLDMRLGPKQILMTPCAAYIVAVPIFSAYAWSEIGGVLEQPAERVRVGAVVGRFLELSHLRRKALKRRTTTVQYGHKWCATATILSTQNPSFRQSPSIHRPLGRAPPINSRVHTRFSRLMYRTTSRVLGGHQMTKMPQRSIRHTVNPPPPSPFTLHFEHSRSLV